MAEAREEGADGRAVGNPDGDAQDERQEVRAVVAPEEAEGAARGIASPDQILLGLTGQSGNEEADEPGSEDDIQCLLHLILLSA